jgi:hypothetical protein
MKPWMDGWMDGWVGGWMGGWMDGWVSGHVSKLAKEQIDLHGEEKEAKHYKSKSRSKNWS